MTNYYIEKDNKIILFDEDRQKLMQTLLFMPQYANLEIQETERPIADFQFTDTDEYKELKANEEREAINKLTLSGVELEREIYRAKGKDFDDIIQQLSSSDSSDDFDIKAFKIELKANTFCRDNPCVAKICTALGCSQEDFDYLFKNGVFPENSSSAGEEN